MEATFAGGRKKIEMFVLKQAYFTTDLITLKVNLRTQSKKVCSLEERKLTNCHPEG